MNKRKIDDNYDQYKPNQSNDEILNGAIMLLKEKEPELLKVLALCYNLENINFEVNPKMIQALNSNNYSSVAEFIFRTLGDIFVKYLGEFFEYKLFIDPYLPNQFNIQFAPINDFFEFRIRRLNLLHSLGVQRCYSGYVERYNNRGEKLNEDVIRKNEEVYKKFKEFENQQYLEKSEKEEKINSGMSQDQILTRDNKIIDILGYLTILFKRFEKILDNLKNELESRGIEFSFSVEDGNYTDGITIIVAKNFN